LQSIPAGWTSDLNGETFVDDCDFVLFAAADNKVLRP
jgi:hypothetical protein